MYRFCDRLHCAAMGFSLIVVVPVHFIYWLAMYFYAAANGSMIEAGEVFHIWLVVKMVVAYCCALVVITALANAAELLPKAKT